MTPLETIPEKLGSSEMLAIGLISRVKGDIQGNAALLFKEEHALRLVQILGSKEEDIPDDGFGDLERSMLEETANITISSFMNSIATHLEKSCIPNAPIYLLDMAGSILAVILMESADVADVALLVSTKFECRNEDLTALFVLLPNPASLHAIEEGLYEK
jgi:chemotaxis protein CheY-P-specific phosphatase CheC